MHGGSGFLTVHLSDGETRKKLFLYSGRRVWVGEGPPLQEE